MTTAKRPDRAAITTKEFTQLTGTTRRILDSLERKNILKPSRSSATKQSEKLWSLEQMQTVQDTLVLQKAGFSQDEISNIVSYGTDTLTTEAYRQLATIARNTRRQMKSVARYKEAIKQAQSITGKKAPYLRYFPQRWFALLPNHPYLDTDESEAHSSIHPNSRVFIEHLQNLQSVIEVSGWSSTNIVGALSTYDKSNFEPFTYTFKELTSPPMPTSTKDKVIDGGCYRPINPNINKSECEEGECFECARFGRMPTSDEIFKWNTAERVFPDIQCRTQFFGDLSSTIKLQGPWGDYMQKGASENLGLEGREDAIRRHAQITHPQLMPHYVALPYGVTACAMPAGVYLCAQDNGNDSANTMQLLLGICMILQRTSTSALEDLPLEPVIEATKKTSLPTVVKEPFSQPRLMGHPALAGYSHDLAQTDYSKLKLMSPAGFTDNDDFCMICSSLPSEDPNCEGIFETQILVNADEFLQEADLL